MTHRSHAGSNLELGSSRSALTIRQENQRADPGATALPAGHADFEPAAPGLKLGILLVEGKSPAFEISSDCTMRVNNQV